MSALIRLASEAIVVRLGWALLHFLWQGALLALLLAAVLAALRRRSPVLRYLVCSGTLAVMAISPAITFALLPPPGPAATVAPRDLQPSELRSRAFDPAIHRDVAPPAASPAPTGRGSPPGWVADLARRVEPLLPWGVGLWAFGVLAISIWHGGAWLRVQRLRRAGIAPVSRELTEVLDHLARRLAIARPVRLLQSAAVRVPTLIGWLKPVVLMPMSVLGGMPLHQLETLLAHELAHIRRADYLVNLLQTVVEALLFYHPAVWWVSRRIRVERELCCDDLVVGVCGDRLSYARALATLEAVRCGSPAMAVGAGSGGGLLARVRRIVGLPCDSGGRSHWLSALLTLGVLAALAAALVCGAGAGLVGCATPQARKPMVFVPIVEREFVPWKPGEAPPTSRGQPEPDRTLPQIRIDSRVFNWPVADGATLGWKPGEPATILSPEAYKKLLERLSSKARTSLLFAPRLTVYSTQTANFQILDNYNYVAGYDLAKPSPDKSVAREPVIGNVPAGLIADFQAVAEGADVTFTAISARLNRLVRACDCVVVEHIGRKEAQLVAQEPLILTAKAQLPEPCSVRLKPGEAVLVPIVHDSLRVVHSNLRALVREGKARIRNDESARFLAKLDKRGYPVEGEQQTFIVLTASVLKKGE